MALALCLTLLPTAALAADGHQNHCVCGNKNCSAHGSDITDWQGVNALTAEMTAGHYYLTDNVTLSSTWNPVDGTVLCLNGYSIKADGDITAIYVSDITFTLCDCKGDKGAYGQITHVAGKTGSGVYVRGNGVFYMYGGSISGNTANNGGGVYMAGGQFTMYGGSITNTPAENGSDNNGGNGGGVYVGGGTFSMSGGEISGGNKAKYGGGVYVKNGGTFNMNDGAISENTANQGGGVSVSTDGTFTMSGGTIGGTNNGEANKAKYGGGVNVDKYGTFEMSGGEISGNKADQNGGGVYVDGGKFEMKGEATSVSNNTATGDQAGDNGNGGGVYVNSGTFTMNGSASITKNNAATKSYGGGVYVKNGGTFNMNDGAISENTANQGGGVYASGGDFTMSGGSITNNTINGVYVRETATFTVSGAPTVKENKREKAASNVFLQGSKTTITIGGKLDAGASIGVDTNLVPGEGKPIVVAEGSKKSGSPYTVKESDAEAFFSDRTYQHIEFLGDNVKLCYGAAHTPTPEHKHIWAYTLSGDHKTITATCTNSTGDCAYRTTPATVTISMAQSTYTYSKDMETPTAQLTHSDNWPEDVARAKEADIKYFKSTDGGNSYGTSVTHPDGVKAVGMYLARLSFNGKYIEAHFSVVDNSKQNPTYTAPTAKKDLVYTGENQPLIDPGSTNHGRMWYKLGTDDIYSTLVPMAKDAGSYTVYYKVEGDATHNDVAEQSIEVTIAKAQLSGTPTFTKVTEAGKTLKNVTLTKPKDWPEGTFEWGTGATETSKDTQILQGQEYWWYYRSANHSATGKIVPWANPSSGDGSGSGSSSGSYDSNPIIKTETKNNPDGSTTKTETRKDGSVTATTTGKDGSTSKTETKKDGSSVTENKAADGSTGTVKTDKNGQIEAKTALSNKAIEAAKKNGEAVKAPLEVEASRNSNTAPTVKVELPKNAGETEVEIPVSNAKPGTVAVLVHPDGTEEILKNSVPTEGGIRLTVDGSATVKIVDNSKGFIDIRNHWAEDEIDFVSARGLVNGVSDTIYAPNNSTTRAQLWTILARQNDANLNGGNTWYEKAQNWAKSEGVSDGTDPNADINRAQMVTMLWRAVGQPAASRTASFIDVPADAYYAGAVSWAVENGITVGVGGGRFDPNGTCTRAQVAAFLARHMK